jgi:hypothetical protein
MPMKSSPQRPSAQVLGSGGRTAEYALRLGIAVFGLILVEQLLRRHLVFHELLVDPRDFRAAADEAQVAELALPPRDRFPGLRFFAAYPHA